MMNTNQISIKTDNLVASAQKYFSASKSKNTQRAYASAMKRFEEFSKAIGYNPIPTEVKVLSMYVTKLAEEGAKPSTIDAAVAAIKYFNKQNNSTLDTSNNVFSSIMEGIKRTKGTKQDRSTAITKSYLKIMVCNLDMSLQDTRTKAMILIGFSCAMRRSEILNLTVDDIQFFNEGMSVNIRQSKTDQTKEGQTLYISHASDVELCPIHAVKGWIELSGISEGPLFQSIDCGSVTGRQLSENAFYVAFNNLVTKSGLEGKITPHSLRAGFCTVASYSGVSIERIADHARHKVLDTTRRYIRPVNNFNNASKGLI